MEYGSPFIEVASVPWESSKGAAGVVVGGTGTVDDGEGETGLVAVDWGGVGGSSSSSVFSAVTA